MKKPTSPADVLRQSMRLRSKARGLAFALATAAATSSCGDGPLVSREADDGVDTSESALGGAKIVATQVSRASDLPAEPPRAGAYRVHMIDVGSGLSMLVQGHDFNLLYDGGSNDDSRGIAESSSENGNESRLLAYLFATVGPSGGPECIPKGDRWQPGVRHPERRIQHLFLSHAHRDHVSMLADVLHCYAVDNVWEPGAAYPRSKVYTDFFAAVAAERGVRYHTAAAPQVPLPQTILGAPIPRGFSWVQLAEGDTFAVGAGATIKVLAADGAVHNGDVNLNSIVLRLTLGRASMLAMGDAEGGHRGAPDASAALTEGGLLARHGGELAVDILQVAHHGSSTSSRSAFLDAAFPGKRIRYALLSAGPTPYSGVTLPDASVMGSFAALAASGVRLLTTNVHDPAHGSPVNTCPSKERVGVDDASPGGCDNHVLDIGP